MQNYTKTVTSYYPKGRSSKPDSIKVFQDTSNQVRGFRLKREFLNDIGSEEHSSNPAIYFLFNNERDLNGQKAVYIGKSSVGYKRLKEHVREKDFWTHAMIFVSDNNTFDANSIDYMEYYFINYLLTSESYRLENTDMRRREPNISYIDKSIYSELIRKIAFLLETEGVYFDEEIPKRFKESESAEKEVGQEISDDQADVKYYIPVSPAYEGAKVFYDKINDKFVVESGSIINIPNESLKARIADSESFYILAMSRYNQHKNKISEIDEKHAELTGRIGFSTPTGAANFIAANKMNGWNFFDGIQELRDNR